LPARVRGPVLRGVRRAVGYQGELAVDRRRVPLGGERGGAQPLREGAAAVDRVQRRGAADLGRREHALDALELVDAHRERAGRDVVHVEPGGGEPRVHAGDGGRVACRPIRRVEIVCADRAQECRHAVARPDGEQVSLQPPQPHHVPRQIDDVAHQELLDDALGRDRRGDAGGEPVVGVGILAAHHGRRRQRKGFVDNISNRQFASLCHGTSGISCVFRIDLARVGACRKAKEKSAPVIPVRGFQITRQE
jgi:hypothetical protein